MTYEVQRRDLFLFCHKPHITNLISQSCRNLPRDLAAIVAEYVTGDEDCFGAEDFKRYFNVSCENPRELPFTPAFYKFWHGTDPFDRSHQRCETHHLPFIRPQRVITLCKTVPYDFEMFKKLVQCPAPTVQGFNCFGIESVPKGLKTDPEPLAWVVVRKDLVARNQDYFTQRCEVECAKSGYEPRPPLMDLVTFCAAEYFKRGRRCLGDEKGEEKQNTSTTCSGMINDGWLLSEFLIVGPFSLRGLRIHVATDSEVSPGIGIVALRPF
jgi:hypothetical protein